MDRYVSTSACARGDVAKIGDPDPTSKAPRASLWRPGVASKRLEDDQKHDSDHKDRWYLIDNTKVFLGIFSYTLGSCINGAAPGSAQIQVLAMKPPQLSIHQQTPKFCS